LYHNKSLADFFAPVLEQVGFNCLHDNESLTSLSAISLVEVGDGFLFCNTSLTIFDAPVLKLGGSVWSFLTSNKNIDKTLYYTKTSNLCVS
jgi:hypothetical protein